MLPNVSKSDRAIKVIVQIVRVFVEMRQMVQDYRELLERLREISIDFTQENSTC